MPLYLTDGLEPAEREALRKHIASGCPRCAGALAEWETTFAAVPLALEDQAPAPALRQTLIDQLPAQEVSPSRPAASVPARKPMTLRHKLKHQSTLRPFAMAAGFAGILVCISAWVVLRESRAIRSNYTDQLNRQKSDIAKLEERLGTAEQRLRLADQTNELLRSPDVRIYALAGADPQPTASAKIFWSPSQNAWRVEAQNMKPAGPGKTYEVWYIPKGQPPISAGIFDVDATGHGTSIAKIPQNAGPLAIAAITDERAGGSIGGVPKGQIQLAYKAE